MYINFDLLFSLGYNQNDLFQLQAIKQQSTPIIDEAFFSEFQNKGLIEFVKQKGERVELVRLAKKGRELLDKLETPISNPEIDWTLIKAIELYSEHGKDIGTKKNAEKRLNWFMCNTNFNSKSILTAIDNHLNTSGDYTMKLENYIWKPESTAFSIHQNLKTSKLFDDICWINQIDSEFYFLENQDKELQWLFAISRLPEIKKTIPIESTFTGSINGDIEAIKRLKSILYNKIKK